MSQGVENSSLMTEFKSIPINLPDVKSYPSEILPLNRDARILPLAHSSVRLDASRVYVGTGTAAYFVCGWAPFQNLLLIP
jgi:hypothetical protein